MWDKLHQTTWVHFTVIGKMACKSGILKHLNPNLRTVTSTISAQKRSGELTSTTFNGQNTKLAGKTGFQHTGYENIVLTQQEKSPDQKFEKQIHQEIKTKD